MKRFVFLALFLMTYALITEAQTRKETPATSPQEGTVLFQEETSKTFTIMHIASAFAHREHTNIMVERMGRLQKLTPPNSFRTALQYVESTTIERDGAELILRASLRFTGFASRRDASGFDYTEFLYPDRMNFRIQLLDAQRNALYQEVLEEVVLSAGREGRHGYQIASLRVSDEWAQEGISLRITEVVSPVPMPLFYHSLSKQESFFHFLGQVSEYEMDARLVVDRAERLTTIRVDDPDLLSGQMDLLQQYKEEVDGVTLKGWSDRLPLATTDPAGLVKGFETFSGRYQEKLVAVQHAMRNMDEAYYQRGMEALRRNNRVQALEWFQKAISFNPGHGKSHLEIARLHYADGELDKAADLANKILSTMSPDRGLSSEIYKLLNQVQDEMSKAYRIHYEKLVAEAVQAQSQGRMREAIQALSRATEYRDANSIYLVDNKRVEQVATRIIEKMTAEAEQDIRAGKYRPAIEKLSGVLNEWKTHGSGVISTTTLEDRIRAVRDMLTDQIAEKARRSIQRGDYNETETLINEVVNTTQMGHGGGAGGTTIVNTLVDEYIAALYNQGKQLLNQGSYARAFELFNQTLTIAGKYGINPPVDIYLLIDETRNGVFRGMLFAGEQALNNRDFQAAEFYLQEAIRFLQNKATGDNRMALEGYTKKLLVAFVDEGRKYLDNRNYQKAIEYFDRADEVEVAFGVADSRLGDLRLDALEGIGVEMLTQTESLLNRRNFPEAMQGLKEGMAYIRENGLSGHSQGKLMLVADQYFRESLSRIDQANRGRKFEDALTVLEEARYLCDNLPLRCETDVLEKRERDSRQGIYNGKVQQAERALTRGDLGQANTLIREANDYQMEWGHLITQSPAAREVAGKIRRNQYQQAINSGKSLLDMKDYRRALTHFDEAFTLEQEGGFLFDSKLKEYRRKAALQTLMAEADQLERMLGESSYMATKDKLLQIMSMRARYDLQDHETLAGRLNALQSRMISAACLQQQTLMNDNLQQAEVYEQSKEFIEAGKVLQRAIDAANQHPDCALSDTVAQKQLARIGSAIRYQETMNKSVEMRNLYKNAEALTNYIQAEKIFEEEKLDRLGVVHEPFAAHVLKQNLNYILSAAYYYHEKGDLKAALRMIDALSGRGYPPAQTRLLQEQIGLQLGKADREKYPGSSWKGAVLQYTGGKKFYKQFRRAYKKGWRSK
jgi:tetratricopeptide (TPR) repeat protein